MFFLKGHQSVTKKQGLLVFLALISTMAVVMAFAPITYAKELTLTEKVKASLLYANLLNRSENSGNGSGWYCVQDMEGYRYRNGGDSSTDWPPSSGDNAANQNNFVGAKAKNGIKGWKGVDPITKAASDGSCGNLLKVFIDTVEDGSPKYTSFYKRMGGKFFTSTESSETCSGQGVCQSGPKQQRSAWVFRDWSECKKHPHAEWDRFTGNVNSLDGITSPHVSSYALPDSRSGTLPPTSCSPTKGDKAIHARFKDAAKSAFGGTPSIASGSAEQWHMYYSTLTSGSGCNALRDSGKSDVPSDNPDASGNYYYKIPVATKGEPGFVVYQLTNPNGASFWLATTGSDGQLTNITCGNIANWLQNNPSAFEQYNDYAKQHPGELGIGQTVEETAQGSTDSTKDAAEEGGEEDANCSTHLTGAGWFLCPLIDLASGFADSSWGLLEGLLVLKPLEDNSIYETWQKLRDIANTLLVIMFIVVIISQISNIGLSNYSIKRILPRFIIAAILINISYFAMQLVVDISNILGATLLELITSTVELNLEDVGWAKLVGTIIAGGTVTGATIAGVAIAGVVIGIGSMLMFVLLTIIPAIIGIVAGVLALWFRGAVIPILAILAPIAFVAWILPNTQSLFDKWRKVFTGLVLLYPMAAIYYGALKFTALTILGNGDAGAFEHLTGLALLFIGSFVIFGIALKSNSIMSMMMGKMSGALNKVSNPLTNKLSERADLMRNARKAEFMAKDHSKHRVRGFLGRRMQAFDRRTRDLKSRGGIAAQNLEQQYRTGLTDASPEELKRRLGATADTAGGQAYIENIAKEAAARRLKFEFKGNADKALESNDKYLQAAAAEELANSGSWGASVLRSYTERGGAVTSVDMAQAMTKVKKYDAGVAAAGVQAMSDFYNGSSSVGFSREQFANMTATAVGKLSKENTATQSAAALSTAIAKNSLSADKVQDVVNESRLSSVASDDALELLKNFNSDPESTTKQASLTLNNQISQPQPLAQSKPAIPPLGNKSSSNSVPAQPQPQAASGTPSQAPVVQPRQAANAQPAETPPPVQNQAAQPEPRKNSSLFNNRSRNNNRPFN